MYVPDNLKLATGDISRMMMRIEHRPGIQRPWCIYARYSKRNEHMLNKGSWRVATYTSEQSAKRNLQRLARQYHAAIEE